MDKEQVISVITSMAQRELGLAPDVRLTEASNLTEVCPGIQSVRLMSFLESLESELDIEFDIEKLSGSAVTDMAQLLPLINEASK